VTASGSPAGGGGAEGKDMASTYTEREKDEMRAGMHVLGCDHCQWGDARKVREGKACCTYIGGPSVKPEPKDTVPVALTTGWMRRMHRCTNLRWRRRTRR